MTLGLAIKRKKNTAELCRSQAQLLQEKKDRRLVGALFIF